jgi:hypothetical protein
MNPPQVDRWMGPKETQPGQQGQTAMATEPKLASSSSK